MKKASKSAVTKKPAPKAPAVKQLAKPKAAAQSLLKVKSAKTLIPATSPKPAAKPVPAGQAELAQAVTQLSRVANKLAQAADRLAANAEKLGPAIDTLADATRQAATHQPAPAATMPAEKHADGTQLLPDFAESPDDPQEPDTSGGE
jgi:methyl-accepting chemotaxis protein